MASVGEVSAKIVLDGLAGVQKTLKSVGEGLQGVGKQFENMGGKLDKVSGKMKSAGEALQPITVGLTAFGTAGILASENIDNAMSQFESKMGATGGELEHFQGILKNVSKTGVGSFDEVAASIVTVSQNMRGLQPDEIETLTEQAMQLSEVMGYDVTELTKTAGIMMTNFGMTGQDAMDLIAKGYQKGMDFSGDYLDTLSEYSVYFDQMGLSGKEMFNTLISGANAGAFNLDKVGDAVKEFNIRAKDGSDATNEAFEKLGFNASGMGKTFAEGGEGAKKAMEEVVNKLAGVENQQERNAIGIALFGTQYEDMEGDVIAALGGVRDHLGDTENAASNMAEANESFTQQMAGYWNELQLAIKPVGDILKQVALEVLPVVMDYVRQLADAFVALDADTQKLIVGIGAFIAVLAPMLAVGGAVLGTVAKMVDGYGKFFKMLGGGKETVNGFKGAFNGIKKVFMSLGGAFKTVGGFIVKAVTGIGGVVKGLFALIMAHPFIAIGAVIVGLIALIIANWDTVKAVTEKVWGSIKTFFSNLWTSISDTAAAMWGSFTEYLTGVWGGITEKAAAMWQPIADFFTNLWDSIVTGTKAAWDFISNVIQFGIMFIAELFNAAFLLITLPFRFIWENIKEYVFAAWEFIKSAVTNGVTAMVNAIVTFMTPIAQFFITTWETVKQGTINAFNVVKDFLTNVWTAIRDKVSALASAAKDKIVAAWTYVKTKTTTIFNAVKDFAVKAWTLIKDKVVGLATALYTAAMAKFNELKSKLTALWNSIKSFATSIWNAIKTSVVNTVNTLKNSVVEKFNAVKSKATEIWNGIKESISKPINAARDAVKKAIDKIKGYMKFKWSLPKLKMPHFSMTGKFSLNPPQVPKLGVDWYATGGIATGASVVGIGEAGDEAIVPLSNKKRMKPFAAAVSSMMAKGGSGTNDSDGTNAPVITGNTFVIREEADIKKVAQELHKLEKKEKRAKGRG